ncbi:MAG: hypothetical protein NUV34_00965 [Sulfuricaulis sp.]|nr:hypothetical protein [Sulfuricaulis sp.]
MAETVLERFWAGDFGEAYTARSQGADILAARIAMFSRILERAPGVNSVIELGANTGINLKAISLLLPHAKLWGVEVNEEAALQIPVGKVIIGSILDQLYDGNGFHLKCDLAFTRGVLIHVAPEDLPRAYDALYRASRRYIMICEYFNPTHTMVPYRGHDDRLWKRDFAGEMLDRFKDLHLIDCAFVYKRGEFGQDNVTWFLMEKRR